MCHPAVVMVVMAAAAAGQQMMQNKRQNQLMEAQAEASNKATSFKYQQLAEQRREVDEQAAQDKFQRQLQSRRELSTIMVASGEAGVGGNSVLRVMNNAMMQGSYDQAVIEANRASKARQISTEAVAAHLGNEAVLTESNIGSIDAGIGAMNVGLAGVSGAAEGYSMGSAFKGKTMGTKKKYVHHRADGLH